MVTESLLDRPTTRPALESLPRRGVVGLVLVLASALALLPGASQPYPMAKAAVAAVGAALVLSLRRRCGLPVWITIWIAVAIVALLIAALMSENPMAAVFGRFPRYEGVWVVTTYLAVLAAGARLRFWRNARELVERTLAVAALVVCAVAAFQQLVPSGSYRVESVFGNASDLGAWAAIVALVLMPRVLERDPLAIAGVAAALISLVLSASRGALLGLAVGLVFLLVCSYRSRRGLWLVGIGLGVGLLALLTPFTRDRLTGESPLAAGTAAGRTWLWADTVTLLREHPIFGVGPSGFVDGIGAAHGAGWTANVGPVKPPDSPHNLVLQMLSAGGIFFGLALLVIAVLWVVYARRSWLVDSAPIAGACAGLAAYVVTLMTHFTSPGTTVTAAFLGGWVVSTQLPTKGPALAMRERLSPKLGQWLPVVVVAVTAVVLAATSISEVFIARAISATEAGRVDQSKQDWQIAARLRPWDSDLTQREARAYSAAVQRGVIPAATCLAPTLRAYEQFPSSSEVAVDRALCLDANVKYSDAFTVVSTALQRDPANVDLAILAGVTKAEAGDLNQAEKLLLEAAALRPTSPVPWQDLAVVYDRIGNTSAAANARARAAELKSR